MFLPAPVLCGVIRKKRCDGEHLNTEAEILISKINSEHLITAVIVSKTREVDNRRGQRRSEESIKEILAAMNMLQFQGLVDGFLCLIFVGVQFLILHFYKF